MKLLVLIVLLTCLTWVRAQAKVAQDWLAAFCASTNCQSAPEFAAWVFKKDSSDNYINKPCTPPIWDFITCTGTDITGLDYPGNSGSNFILSGTIPPGIDYLGANLKVIKLVNQNLQGTFPNDIINLNFLTEVNLAGNALTGPLQQQNPDAAYNQFTTFIVKDNYFSGSFPFSVTKMPALVTLDLSSNQLTGTLPAAGVLGLKNLQSIVLRDNRFSGSVPTTIYQLGELTSIDFGQNKFSGTMPGGVASLKKLLNYYIDGNLLTSSIPTEFYSMTGLQRINLRHNKISGSVDKSLEKMTSLVELSLGANEFNGPIPDTSKLTNLQELDLSYNNWDRGTIPGAIYKSATQLTALNLAGVNLVGSLPPEILLPKLSSLSLERTGVSGSIPQSIIKMTSLEVLKLSYNSLSGTLPHSMRTLEKLKFLDIYSNKFSGPVDMCSLSNNMVAMSISQNNFNCYNKCWDKATILQIEAPDGITSCSDCPLGTYQQRKRRSQENIGEGYYDECTRCPVGRFSTTLGATSASQCFPCPTDSSESDFGKVNEQCFSTVGSQDKVYVVGGTVYDIASFMTSLIIGAIGGCLLGYFVHRRRSTSSFVVEIPFYDVLVKCSMYGFTTVAELTIALAIISSVKYASYGGTIMAFRLMNIGLSGFVLLKTYNLSTDELSQTSLNLVKRFVRRPMTSYDQLVDAEHLHNPDNQFAFVILALCSAFDMGYLQFLPWMSTNFSLAHQGWPDVNTYMFYLSWKCTQTVMSMLMMFAFLGESSKADRGPGIDVMIALYISVGTFAAFYNIFLEKTMCTFQANAIKAPDGVQDARNGVLTVRMGASVGSPNTESNVSEGNGIQPGDIDGESVFVEAGTGYGRNSDIVGSSNPLYKGPALTMTSNPLSLGVEDAMEDAGNESGSDGDDWVKPKPEEPPSAVPPPAGPRPPPPRPPGGAPAMP